MSGAAGAAGMSGAAGGSGMSGAAGAVAIGGAAGFISVAGAAGSVPMGGAAGGGGLTEADIILCMQPSDCIVVPYSHCCGSTRRAINSAYLADYNAHLEWQVFNDPVVCAVIGVCPDDSAVTDATCDMGPTVGGCRLVYS